MVVVQKLPTGHKKGDGYHFTSFNHFMEDRQVFQVNCIDAVRKI
jgi:hypothetical protein